MKVSSATSLAVIGSTELTLEYLWNKLNKYAISKEFPEMFNPMVGAHT